MQSIQELQQEFSDVISEHEAENNRRTQHQQDGDAEAEQHSMDQLKRLGDKAIQLQSQIATQPKLARSHSSLRA